MTAGFAFPKALEPYRHLKCWVNWKLKAKGNGKFTKLPYRPSDPGKCADASDPATWGSFDEAFANVERGLADGVGICLLGTEGLAGIDLDDCIDASGVEPRALKLIETAASYTELSPGGNGFHIFILSDGGELNRKQAVLNANGMSIEVARHVAKYFTVSGDRWPDAPEVLQRQDGLPDEIVRVLDTEKAGATGGPKERGRNSKLDDVIKNGRYDQFNNDRSRAVWYVVNELIRRGKTDDEIVAVLLDRGGTGVIQGSEIGGKMRVRRL